MSEREMELAICEEFCANREADKNERLSWISLAFEAAFEQVPS